MSVGNVATGLLLAANAKFGARGVSLSTLHDVRTGRLDHHRHVVFAQALELNPVPGVGNEYTRVKSVGQLAY